MIDLKRIYTQKKYNKNNSQIRFSPHVEFKLLIQDPGQLQ